MREPFGFRLTSLYALKRGVRTNPSLPFEGRWRRREASVIEGYFFQLNDMLEDYYDYLDVTEVEECPTENK